MEESELDEWFNEQKELLEERVAAGLQGKDPVRAKHEFDAKYKALIVEFQKRQEQIYESKERSIRLQKPVARAKERFATLIKRIADDYKNRKLIIKKWFFDRKIRRIVRDKRDL